MHSPPKQLGSHPSFPTAVLRPYGPSTCLSHPCQPAVSSATPALPNGPFPPSQSWRQQEFWFFLPAIAHSARPHPTGIPSAEVFSSFSVHWKTEAGIRGCLSRTGGFVARSCSTVVPFAAFSPPQGRSMKTEILEIQRNIRSFDLLVSSWLRPWAVI